jgi:hypothetical protein
MVQLFWYVLQGGIIAGLYVFLRSACSDCAPIAAGTLAVIAALTVTVTIVGLYESAIAVRDFIQRRRAKQSLDQGTVRLRPGALGKRSPRPNHLTKLRHLPPH